MALMLVSGVCFWACTKGDEINITGPVVAPDPCKTRVIQVTASTDASSPCVNNGVLQINAIGSQGFTYSVNGSGYQASNTFTNLPPGDHIYLVKDITGCIQSASVNVGRIPMGPLFRGVRTLLINNCNTCHRSPNPSGGRDFTNDCEILNSATAIKKTSVDGSHFYMQQTGPLSTIDKATIMDWINAGAKYTD